MVTWAKLKSPQEEDIHFDARARFWSKVSGGESCWEWNGSRNEDGYGIVKRDGKLRKAHRLAYELAWGPIPDGLLIRHRCDNPPCCRPTHLIPGTKLDNARDRDRRYHDLYEDRT